MVTNVEHDPLIVELVAVCLGGYVWEMMKDDAKDRTRDEARELLDTIRVSHYIEIADWLVSHAQPTAGNMVMKRAEELEKASE